MKKIKVHKRARNYSYNENYYQVMLLSNLMQHSQVDCVFKENKQ